jgi:MFS family permease
MLSKKGDTTMTKEKTQPKHGRLCRALRVLTALFAALGPVALIAAAVAATLLENDWWSEMFLVYLALYTLLGFTSYLGLLTILWELTRYARRKKGEDLRDTPLTVILHRILGATAVMGLVTVVILPLILFDLLNGGFAVIHFAIGGLMALLYAVLGVYAIIRRIMDHRRAEAQRLEEEKRAWKGYLS